MDQGFGKKYYVFLLLGVLLLLLSTIVYAEAVEDPATTSTTSSIIEIQEEESTSTTNSIDNQIATNTENIPSPAQVQNTTINNHTALSLVTQTRITNLCANISNRLDAVIARQENIAKRLQNRINKMETQNLNVGEGEEKLAIAMTTINQAKDAIKNIDTEVHNTVTATTPSTEWLLLRATYIETENLARQAQEDLKSVISLLKNPSVSALGITEVNVTTSTPVNE